MLKPFYMLNGQITLVKEINVSFVGKDYIEKMYVDELGDRAIVSVPIEEKE